MLVVLPRVLAWLDTEGAEQEAEAATRRAQERMQNVGNGAPLGMPGSMPRASSDRVAESSTSARTCA